VGPEILQYARNKLSFKGMTGIFFFPFLGHINNYTPSMLANAGNEEGERKNPLMRVFSIHCFAQALYLAGQEEFLPKQLSDDIFSQQFSSTFRFSLGSWHFAAPVL
jgi:hypothetical protein